MHTLTDGSSISEKYLSLGRSVDLAKLYLVEYINQEIQKADIAETANQKYS